MSLRKARQVFLVLLLAFTAGPALGAEMNAAAINSAEPSKKTLSSEKPTPARSTASSERTRRKRCAPTPAKPAARPGVRIYATCKECKGKGRVAG